MFKTAKSWPLIEAGRYSLPLSVAGVNGFMGMAAKPSNLRTDGVYRAWLYLPLANGANSVNLPFLLRYGGLPKVGEYPCSAWPLPNPKQAGFFVQAILQPSLQAVECAPAHSFGLAVRRDVSKVGTFSR